MKRRQIADRVFQVDVIGLSLADDKGRSSRTKAGISESGHSAGRPLSRLFPLFGLVPIVDRSLT